MNRRFLPFLGLVPILALAGMSSASAAPAGGTIPMVACPGLAGCGQPAMNVFAAATLPAVISLLIRLVAGGAVVAIVVAGTELMLKSSDEGATAAKKAVLYALGGLGLAVCASTIVTFVTSENYGQANPNDLIFGAGGVLQSVIRIIMVLFNMAFVIIIIYAGFRMSLSGGSTDEFKRGGNTIKWAVVGAVLVNLAKALVQAFIQLDL